MDRVHLPFCCRVTMKMADLEFLMEKMESEVDHRAK